MSTVNWLRAPITIIPVGTFVPPADQVAAEHQFADWLNVDPELVYQPPFGGHPVVLYPDSGQRREWCPHLDAETSWLPLLWPTEDMQERYDGEDDFGFALRILYDFADRDMYNPVRGEWFPVWAVWETVSVDEDGWVDKVHAWLDGSDDADLDDMEPGPLPDGADPDGPYRRAQTDLQTLLDRVAAQAVEWAIRHLQVSVYDISVDEAWERLCGVVDALAQFADGWASWGERNLPVLEPIKVAAAATGVRGGFDQQAQRLIDEARSMLDDADAIAG